MKDYYDEDLPEASYQSWADFIKENKSEVVLISKFVGIPTGLFILTCIANYFINKKLDSL